MNSVPQTEFPFRSAQFDKGAVSVALLSGVLLDTLVN